MWPNRNINKWTRPANHHIDIIAVVKMDHLFQELVGKPTLNQPKIITVVADNFSFLEHQARFLKATIAIPILKQFPVDDNIRLVQIGNIHQEICDYVDKLKWTLYQYDDNEENLCDKMAEDLLVLRERSIIFINDVSRLELTSRANDEPKKFLALVDKLKRVGGHFVVMLYQNSCPESSTRFLSNIEYMSDAVVHAKHCKVGYFMSMWFETIPQAKTLIPPKIEQSFYTCKIGTNYWFKELLCFYDKKKVPKNYNPQTDTFILSDDTKDSDQQSEKSPLGSSDEESTDESRTLPYTRAANPENSRIFFYPDRDDDLDEDDPDNDLGI